MQAGEYKVYNQRSVIDRDAASGDNYVSQSKFEELRPFAVAPGDLLITTRGTIGRCFILPDDAEPGILHPCLMRIRSEPKLLLSEFLALLIQDSSLVQTQLFLLSNATTIEVIYSDTMKRAIVPVPPVEEQRQILAFLNRETAKLDALIAKVWASIGKLREYRAALISAAVTGKVDVSATDGQRING